MNKLHDLDKQYFIDKAFIVLELIENKKSRVSIFYTSFQKYKQSKLHG